MVTSTIRLFFRGLIIFGFLIVSRLSIVFRWLSFLGALAPGKTGNRFAVNGQVLSKTIQIIITELREHFEDFSQFLVILSQFRHEAAVTARRRNRRIAVKDVEAVGLGQ